MCAPRSWAGRKTKIKVPAHLVSGESPLPWLHMATSSPCPHMVKEEREDSGVSSYINALILSDWGCTLTDLSLNLNDFLTPKTVMLEGRASACEFGET